jgi:SHS2 domain-containing protein
MQDYYEEIEHTADLALIVRAQTFLGILQQATHGMLHLMGIDAALLTSEKTYSAVFFFTALEDVLVQGLNEILFHLETETLLFIPQDIQINGTQATILYTGGLCLQSYQEIKALTYHQMELIQDDAGLHTILVFDV